LSGLSSSSDTILAIRSHPLLTNQLAFCGGAALHKLILCPQARYSEPESARLFVYHYAGNECLQGVDSCLVMFDNSPDRYENTAANRRGKAYK
jgi:hypothetical protein